ncbi:MAG: hypothetical protein JNJ58_09340 [Chitinophagaceae bacterium]|nr:hypothetical protein [Chitinophagaceae bacterium]
MNLLITMPGGTEILLILIVLVLPTVLAIYFISKNRSKSKQLRETKQERDEYLRRLLDKKE